MATNQNNPLAAPSLSKYIAASLPKDADPQLKSPTDAVAAAVHAGMISVGFRLVGLGEDHRIGVSVHGNASRAMADLPF